MSEDNPLAGSWERHVDAERQAEIARAEKFRADMEARRPAPPQTAAERDQERQEREQLRKDLDLTRRVVVKHGDDIRALKTEVQTLRAVVSSLQRQRIAAAWPRRGPDHLDDAIERDLITD